MLNVNATIKGPAEAQREIGKAVARGLNKVIRSAVAEINRDIVKLTQDFLRRSKFAQNFVNGELAGHLGVPAGEGESRISAVIDKIVEDISVTFQEVKWQPSGRMGVALQFTIGQDQFAKALSLPEADIITEKGQILEWLRWSLFEGDRVIVAQYDVAFIFGRGRSGQAIMLPGFGWRMPAEFSGTEIDNWITRDVKRYMIVYFRIASNIIKRRISTALK